MSYQITVTYSEALLRTATRRFLVKLLGWDYLVVCILMLISLVTLVATGQRGWFVGVVGAVLVLAVLVAASVSVGYHRRAMSALRAMKTPQATWTFDDEGIAVESEVSAARVKWRAIEKLWCFPEVWLLFVAKGVYSTLPTDSLPSELKTFILAKLQEAGAKVYRPRHVG